MAAAQARNKMLLDLISDVKARLEGKVDAVSFPIPQFVVVGKQSVGKSRLIEALAGETFNFVCGTLGSRRPTVLEFRNAPHPNKWHVYDDSIKQWSPHSVEEVCVIVGRAHESLGTDVSDIPVRVKVEGQDCVDLGIVDLPGFRAYAKDAAGQQLSTKIDKLAQSYMSDENNVMLCVEEAGDNVGFSTLGKCKMVDPNYRRTVLIRNKFDKYYNDLTAENVNKWLEGMGDLPPNLHRFALSLPHAADGNFSKPFSQMRLDCAKKDVEMITSKNASDKYKKLVGFTNFQYFIQVKTQQIFADALGPMLLRLKDMRDENSQKLATIQEEKRMSDPNNILHETRASGLTFAQAFNHLMEGALSSEHNRVTMEQELKSFDQFCNKPGKDGKMVLTKEERECCVAQFGNLDAYINYLRDKAKLPGMDVELNGGAQFRRLMVEVEIFVRFAGLGQSFSASDVIQARGTGSGWEDIIVKLLMMKSPQIMQSKSKYVGARLSWFFSQQKEATVEFMASIEGSPSEHMYSALIYKKAKFIQNNDTMRNAIFAAYDKACKSHEEKFESMWSDYMNAMFQSPMKLLKSCTMPTPDGEDDLNEDEGLAPTFDTTKERIETEMRNRNNVHKGLGEKIKQIPSDDTLAQEAQRRVSNIIEEVFGRIRSLVADQMQLYSESFFLLPMLRRLEGEMVAMEMPETDKKRYAQLRMILGDQEEKKKDLVDELTWCVDAVQKFKITCVP